MFVVDDSVGHNYSVFLSLQKKRRMLCIAIVLLPLGLYK